MKPLRHLALAALLGATALAGPAAAEPASESTPWRVHFSAAVEERRGLPAAAPRLRRFLVPGRQSPGEARREEASLDARYRLELSRTSALRLRYRGTVVHEDAVAPRDRQRHVPELRFHQRLAEGWTAQIGWQARAEWEEGEFEALRLGEQSFAELDVDLGRDLGRTHLRYEHRGSGLLPEASAAGSRHRLALGHHPPRIPLGEDAALELRSRLVLTQAEVGAAGQRRSLGARLSGRLETGAGPRLRARLAYTRRMEEGLGTEGHGSDEDVLGVDTGIELPLREGLRLELGLGWEGVLAADPPRPSAASRLHARTGLELRF